MGILNGILRIKGNVGELNFVNYGQKIIVRRKRGTVKPAKINKKFQDNANRNPAIMKTARPLIAFMKEYTESKRLGRFWPNMLGLLLKCKNDKLETHLKSLKEMELNNNYQVAQRVKMQGYAIRSHPDHFIVDLKLRGHAIFDNDDVDCYFYELTAILWDKDEEITQHTSIPTPWVYHGDEEPLVKMKFERTNWEKYYLLILKVQAGIEGKVSDLKPDSAIIILGGGILE